MFNYFILKQIETIFIFHEIIVLYITNMSNSSFSGVFNEIYGKINAVGTVNSASINAGSVRTGTINCDSVQISLPKAAIIIPTSANYTLTNADLSLMARGDVLYQDFTEACVFQLNTADTAAEALRLLTLFNIPDTTTTRLIRLNRVNTIRSFQVAIGADVTVSSTKYVKYILAGFLGSADMYHAFADDNAHRKAYILVYRGVDVDGEKTIIFDIIGYAHN